MDHSGSPCDPFQIRPAAIGFVESFELRSEELSGGLRPRRMGIHLESVNPEVWRKLWPWIVAWVPYDAIVDSNVSRVSESLGESCDVNVNNPEFGHGFYLFLRGPFFVPSR